jgi:predicted NBD/HSP70 family sugar kinase
MTEASSSIPFQASPTGLGDDRGRFVLAVDLGGTKVIGAVASLDGAILAERVEPTARGSRAELLQQLRDLSNGLMREIGVGWPEVRALSIGVPGTVDAGSGRIALAYNIPDLTGISLRDELAPDGIPVAVLVENDVKVAALGERWQGQAKDSDQFAFVAVGTGVGAGVVIDGRLCRGLNGASGEIGYLPLGGDPFDAKARRRGAFEEAASGRGIVAEVERRLVGGERSELAPGTSAAEIFAAAARGDQLACAVVDREARLVAMAIAAVASVAAPELVVLGGGIGSNELLLEPVRVYAAELTALPLRIEGSALGQRAALIGALAQALEAVGTLAPVGVLEACVDGEEKVRRDVS